MSESAWRMKYRPACLLALLFCTVSVQAADEVDPLANPPTPAFEGQTGAPASTSTTAYRVERLMTDLQAPRSLAALPDGDFLIVLGDGTAHVMTPQGNSIVLEGMPAVRSINGRGFNDLVLDSNFQQNRLVYMSYQAPPPGQPGGPVTQQAATQAAQQDEIFQVPHIARARLSANKRRLENVEVIAEIPGRRLASAPDGTIYITNGGYGATLHQVQDISALAGKMLRINSDGSIPQDNPFVDQANARPEVFSVGHRDPDGAAIHPETGELWTIEHGPMGGDELNVIRPGLNYGWPAITYGKEYDGAEIGGSAAPGLEQPLYYWFPSVAPSGLLFYQGSGFPEWQGSVFVGTMSPSQGKFLVRLELDGERVVAEEHLLVDHDRRVRAVAQGADGAIYVLTDSEDNDQTDRHFPGEVLRLSAD